MSSVPYPIAADGVRCAENEAAGGLSLDSATFHRLFALLGPSLGLWRGAEVAALRTCAVERPILDLGCGDGFVTSLVFSKVDVGVDPWVEATARASERGIYAALHQQPVEACTLPDGCMRTVVSNSVLEHVENLDGVLRATARLLACDGRLVFTVPTEAFGRWLMLPLARYASWRNRAYAHRNLWNGDEWARRLSSAGFDVEEIRPYLRRSIVAVWDGLEVLQRIWVGRRRLFGELWKRLPEGAVAALARRAARLDLSAPPPGGGQMIVARRID